MSTYVLVLSLMAASVLFFTSRTEPSRIITIHRPIMITQERKTPAYFVYQQAQKLPQKKAQIKLQPTTYLSTLSLAKPAIHIQAVEMKFDRRDLIINTEAQPARLTALVTHPQSEVKSLTYQHVFGAERFKDSELQQASQPTTLSHSKKWATIKGKFELIEGVGIVNHYIELKRVEEGQVREVGVIDLKAGLYSIDIESPNGYLIAQIKDQNGGLIGEDMARLINLQSRGSFFEGPFIRVGKPETVAVNPALSASYVSGSRQATYGKAATIASASQGVSVSLFDNQNVLAKPHDVFSNISKFSSTISRVFDPSRTYANVVSIRQTGEKSETAMFTTKWLSGVVEYISDVQQIEFKSKNGPVVIGRILIDGKPVSNAQVQIESEPSLSPIYFDQFMIPSFSQHSTTENGYFMFIGIEPGNYHLVATKKDAVLGSQMFIAEVESIAFQNIATLSTPRVKVIRSFDAFTSAPIATDIVTAESDVALENNTGTLKIKSLADTSVTEYLVRTALNQYVPVRYTQNTKQEYVHIPMIQEQWLNAAREFKKIVTRPNSGTVIGFSTDLSYDVYLASENYNRNDVVFFNSLGHVVTEPSIGGGFILFNVPFGAREVILQEKNSEKIYSQVFNVAVHQVSVAHFYAD